VLIGFAAETEDLVARARAKLARKRVDLIVANDVSRQDAGFERADNAATLVSADSVDPLELQPKVRMAGVILDRLEAMLAGS
jgi:phosphopantothenoylcysteine decarboxylase/phosphopantothenate--cysteine ligase